jgi:DNA-binding NarL/FixJ family response regulator
MSIRIILADDHAVVRDGLAKSLQDQEDLQVIGQAENGLMTVELARELSPDLVIMDIGMPDLNGIEATRQILRESPDVKIIGLSMHSGKKFVTEMFKAGARGYLPKDSELDELLDAIEAVMDGKMYLSPSITGVMVETYIRSAAENKSSAFSVLTPREREVLQLMAEGNSTKQIGRRLFISPKTVEAHRLRIMNKLEIDNVAQLTKYAIQEGLTSPEP